MTTGVEKERHIWKPRVAKSADPHQKLEGAEEVFFLKPSLGVWPS